MSNQQVTVSVNPANGQVFTKTSVSKKDGKQYGFIRLESKELDLASPVAALKSISCLKTMSEDTFNASVEAGLIGKGKTYPGKIQVIETTVKNPNRPLQEPKRIGRLVLTHEGMPIYRDTAYNPNVNAEDVKLQHDQSKEEILAASKAWAEDPENPAVQRKEKNLTGTEAHQEEA